MSVARQIELDDRGFVKVLPSLSLYPHQESVMEDCRAAYRDGSRDLILTMPTGAGKSETAARIMTSTVAKGGRALFVVHRRTLVRQFSSRLRRYGIPHGVLMAGIPMSRSEGIQVASLDTLHRRYFGEGAEGDAELLPDFNVVIYDEAHTRPDMFRRLRDYYEGRAFVIGLTATPADSAGLGLGAYGYERIVSGPTVRWLMGEGYLCPLVRYFGPETYDYSGVTVSRATGEFVEKSADKVVNTGVLVGNVVEHYGRLGKQEPFVVFANSVAHSVRIAERFCAAGIPTVHIDMNTSDADREAAYEGIEDGSVRGLSNYGILDRGFDAPRISVCILARKVRNVVTYRQMVGRVIRAYPGKEVCTVIDHGGNVMAHGFIEDEMAWELRTDKDVNEAARDAAEEREESEDRVITCGDCGAVYAGPSCPLCGWETPARVPKGKVPIETRSALEEIVHSGGADKRVVYGMILGFAAERGYKRGWADNAYREQFGVWPSFPGGKFVIPAALPSSEVRLVLQDKVDRYRRQRYAIKGSIERRARNG